jgi:GT2 family glycosyltransferase
MSEDLVPAEGPQPGPGAAGAAPAVTVVAATHNRAARLQMMLAGLREQTLDATRFEVIVVDDGSADETPEILADELTRGVLDLTVIRFDDAGGPARARNRGWRAARGALIAFTDDDCAPTPGWLDALLTAAGGDPRVVVQGATTPVPEELDRLDAFAKTVHITQATPHFETCNILYPRRLLAAVGGFDESYGAPAGEDSDLGCRVRDAGGIQRFAPEALVHHAVHQRGMRKALDDALMATHGVQAYKQNPELRRHLVQGVFYERSHPLLLQAALALYLARRQPVAAALALPYAAHLAVRARATRTPAKAAAFGVVYDAVQIGATVRGAIRHRFPLL